MAEKQIEKLDECIKMNDHSIQLQNQAALELDAQEETMDRIERNLDRIDANNKKSKKTIQAIKRPFWTAIKSIFVSDKKAEDKDIRQRAEKIVVEERKINNQNMHPCEDDWQIVTNELDKMDSGDGQPKMYHHIDEKSLVSKQDTQIDTLIG